MAANTTPIYSKIADIQWAASTVASGNTTTDLTSGTIYQVFSADTTNGGYVQRIRFRPLGTNTATVARVWLNNGGDTTVSSNNALWDEISIASSTTSQTSALATYELPLNFPLPASYRLYVTLGTSGATGYDVIVIGGKY
jgi:hypothetical protein